MDIWALWLFKVRVPARFSPTGLRSSQSQHHILHHSVTVFLAQTGRNSLVPLYLIIWLCPLGTLIAITHAAHFHTLACTLTCPITQVHSHTSTDAHFCFSISNTQHLINNSSPHFFKLPSCFQHTRRHNSSHQSQQLRQHVSPAWMGPAKPATLLELQHFSGFAAHQRSGFFHEWHGSSHKAWLHQVIHGLHTLHGHTIFSAMPALQTWASCFTIPLYLRQGVLSRVTSGRAVAFINTFQLASKSSRSSTLIKQSGFQGNLGGSNTQNNLNTRSCYNPSTMRAWPHAPAHFKWRFISHSHFKINHILAYQVGFCTLIEFIPTPSMACHLLHSSFQQFSHTHPSTFAHITWRWYNKHSSLWASAYSPCLGGFIQLASTFVISQWSHNSVRLVQARHFCNAIPSFTGPHLFTQHWAYGGAQSIYFLTPAPMPPKLGTHAGTSTHSFQTATMQRTFPKDSWLSSKAVNTSTARQFPQPHGLQKGQLCTQRTPSLTGIEQPQFLTHNIMHNSMDLCHT